MSPPAAGLLLGLLAALAAGQAAAQHAVSVTSSTLLEARGNNHNGDDGDDDYGLLRQRLYLDALADELAVALQLDGFGFVSPPSDRYRDQVLVERLMVGYTGDRLRLTVGDTYQQLGRGIVLALRKADEVSLDVALRGAELGWQGDAHTMRLFAGVTNPTNLDPVSNRWLPDPNDRLAGAAYTLHSAAVGDLGGHLLWSEPGERLLESRDWSVSGGLTADLPALTDWLALYAEVDAQRRIAAGSAQSGLAGYLTADLRLGDTSLLVEGLWLDDFEQKGSRNQALGSRFDYNRPPTLERIEEEILQHQNVAGGRLRLERLWFDQGLLLWLNGVLRFEDPVFPLVRSNTIRLLHGSGGGEWESASGRSRLALSAGYRSDQRLSEDQPLKTIFHSEFDWLQQLGSRWALHLTSLHESRTLAGRPFVRGSGFVGLERGGVGGATLELGYDTQNPTDEVRNFFAAVILAWHPAPAIELRAVAGTQRGGIKCVAGVCRDFPPFAGARLEVVARDGGG